MGKMEEVIERKSSEATEDYLKSIDVLVQEKGFASTSDIAERMGVSKASVTSQVKKLHKQGISCAYTLSWDCSYRLWS